MAKGVSKRGYHKQDANKMNRTALIVGGAVAAALIVAMVVSRSEERRVG
jgi:hypothetical protein